MSSRFVRLLILILLVAVVSIIFILNPQPVVVSYAFGSSVQAPMALVLIIVFCIATVLTAGFSLVLGAQMSYRHWREKKQLLLRDEHVKRLAVIRERIAAGEREQAETLLNQVVAQDPENVPARVMLAENLVERGKIAEAIRVLDETRAGQRRNLEVLFLAAKLNSQTGNLTAAYDNLHLVLGIVPNNERALTGLADFAAALGNWDKAVDFQQRLVRLLSGDAYTQAQTKLAALELEQAKRSSSEQPAKLREALDALLRRHREFAPACEELAELEAAQGKTDSAAKMLSRAYKASGMPKYLARLAELWLKADDPSKAVAAVSSLLSSVAAGSGEAFLRGELFLTGLLLELEMRQEARVEFEKVQALLGKLEEGSPCAGLCRRQATLLHALLLRREGRTDEALDLLLADEEVRSLLKELGFEVFSGPARDSAAKAAGLSVRRRSSQTEQPSPRLSTP